MDKNKKYVVITGAGGGIGKAMVEQAAKAGFTVISLVKNLEQNAPILGKVGKNSILPYEIDLEKTGAIEKFAQFIKNLGTIDWLINNAGIIDKEESGWNLPPDLIERIFRVNTVSPIMLTYNLLPFLRKGGGIINISSTAGLRGNSSFPIYSASKAALNIFSASLASKIGHENYSLITICPGPTNTPMRQKNFNDAEKYQSPDVIANVVTKILTGDSPYSNGDTVIIRDSKEELMPAQQ